MFCFLDNMQTAPEKLVPKWPYRPKCWSRWEVTNTKLNYGPIAFQKDRIGLALGWMRCEDDTLGYSIIISVLHSDSNCENTVQGFRTSVWSLEIFRPIIYRHINDSGCNLQVNWFGQCGFICPQWTIRFIFIKMNSQPVHCLLHFSSSDK